LPTRTLVGNSFTPETRIPVKTNIETIGPKTATKYLENQAKNRPVNKRKVKAYAAVMAAGAWETTHQGIAFDAYGKLIDGQHRLHAIVLSGKTVKMQVTRYTDDAPMAVVDSGKPRNAGDRLMIAGIVPNHGHLISSILVAMLIAETGTYSGVALQPHESKALFDQEKSGIRFAINAFGAKHSRQWNAIIRAGFAYCYMFAPKEVEALATQVREKCALKKGSAAHAFVVALAENKLGYSKNTSRADAMAKVLWLIRQHIEGKKIERVKATASVFNWARRSREQLGVNTMAQALAR
jgi:hypothetical protein